VRVVVEEKKGGAGVLPPAPTLPPPVRFSIGGKEEAAAAAAAAAAADGGGGARNFRSSSSVASGSSSSTGSSSSSSTGSSSSSTAHAGAGYMDAGVESPYLEGEEDEVGGWEGGREEGRDGVGPEEERPTSAARKEGGKEDELESDDEVDDVSPLSGAASVFSRSAEEEAEEEEGPEHVHFSDVDRIILIPARSDYDEETKELLWWGLEDYLGFKKRSLKLLNMGKKEFVTLDPIELEWEEEERRVEGRDEEEEEEEECEEEEEEECEEEEEEAVEEKEEEPEIAAPVAIRARPAVVGGGERVRSPSPNTRRSPSPVQRPRSRTPSPSLGPSLPVRLTKTLDGEEMELSLSSSSSPRKGGREGQVSPLLSHDLTEDTLTLPPSGPTPSIYSYISHNTTSHLLALPHAQAHTHRRYSSLSSSPVDGASSSLPLSPLSLLLASPEEEGGMEEEEAAAAGRRYDYLVSSLDLATALGGGREGGRKGWKMIMKRSGHEGTVSSVHLREEEILELSQSQASGGEGGLEEGGEGEVGVLRSGPVALVPIRA